MTVVHEPLTLGERCAIAFTTGILRELAPTLNEHECFATAVLMALTFREGIEDQNEAMDYCRDRGWIEVHEVDGDRKWHPTRHGMLTASALCDVVA